MVEFQINIKVALENLTKLKPIGPYMFKIECTHCHERSLKYICVEDSGSVMKYKCKFCKKQGKIQMLGQICPLTHEQSEHGVSAPAMRLRFDGFEPIDFILPEKWKVTSMKDGQERIVTLEQGYFGGEYECESQALYDVQASFDVIRHI